IDIEFVAFVGVMHPLDFARLQRNDFAVCAGFVERLAWFCQFNLLETIRHKDGHFFPIEFSCHKVFLLLMLICSSKVDSNKITKPSGALDALARSPRRSD